LALPLPLRFEGGSIRWPRQKAPRVTRSHESVGLPFGPERQRARRDAGAVPRTISIHRARLRECFYCMAAREGGEAGPREKASGRRPESPTTREGRARRRMDRASSQACWPRGDAPWQRVWHPQNSERDSALSGPSHDGKCDGNSNPSSAETDGGERESFAWRTVIEPAMDCRGNIAVSLATIWLPPEGPPEGGAQPACDIIGMSMSG
jgi:hypothetical protein